MTPATPDTRLIELIDRIADQDAAALKQLYDLTASKLYGLALRVTGKTEWAEDALQDSFLYLWRAAPSYRTTLSPPMAWLCLVVRSRSLDLIRRQKAERTFDHEAWDDEMAEHIASDTPSPDDSHAASQQAQALNRCLSALDNKQREVLTLAYLRDLSHQELSDQLRLPLGTVKSWIRRGLDKLRGCLSPQT